MQYALSKRYYDYSNIVPRKLILRRVLHDGLAMKIAREHIIVRGIPKIGKTVLMREVIRKCPDGMKASFSLKDVKSKDGVDEIIRRMMELLGKHAGKKAEIDDPMKCLADFTGNVFIGIDDVDALAALSEDEISDVLGRIRNPPANVHIILASQKNPKVDRVMEKELPGYAEAMVPHLGDGEVDYLIREPARECNVGYSKNAADRIAELSGNRPWDAFILGYFTTAVLEQYYNPAQLTPITLEQVEHIVDLPDLDRSFVGNNLLKKYRRLVEHCVTREELDALKKMSSGVPMDQEMMERLQRFGILNGSRINGALLHEVIEVGFPVS